MSLYLRLDFFEIEELDDISGFNIVEIFDADPALIATLDFFDIVFLSSQ